MRVRACVCVCVCVCACVCAPPCVLVNQSSNDKLNNFGSYHLFDEPYIHYLRIFVVYMLHPSVVGFFLQKACNIFSGK